MCIKVCLLLKKESLLLKIRKTGCKTGCKVAISYHNSGETKEIHYIFEKRDFWKNFLFKNKFEIETFKVKMEQINVGRKF